MNDILAPNAPVTMSSREIADLTGKQHLHVRRDVKKMLTDLGQDERGYIQTWIDPQNGQEYEEYALPQNLTYTLVAGYRADLRLKIVNRWMDLERGAAKPHPAVPTSFREALLLAAEQQEKIEEQAKALTIAQPKSDALDRISLSDGSYGLYEAAKILQVKPKGFVAFLATHRWIYRRPGSVVWLAYQDRIDCLCLWHKVDTYTDANGEEKTRNTVKVLPMGIVKLAQAIPGAQIDPALEGAIRMAAREKKVANSPFVRTPEAVS